jgi:Sulfotransferase domain
MGYIVWLASYPKSGNTWLRAFIKNLLDPHGAFDINRLGDFIPYEIDARYYSQFDARPVAELTRAEIVKLRPQVQRLIAASTQNARFVKTHSARVIEGTESLIAADVTKAAIYLVRNPLDIAVSFSLHRAKSIDSTIEAMNLLGAVIPATEGAASEHFGSWSENVASWAHRGDASTHVVRYEDMIEAPVKTFSGILSHLGIRESREHLERAMKRSSFRVLREQERRHGFTERYPGASVPFFREGRVGQWRDVLAPQQVERIVEAHRMLMKKFGYLP